MKLKKTKAVQWMGNGMGTETAHWVIEGAEHVEVWKSFQDWTVTDRATDKTLVRYERTRGEAVARLHELVAQGTVTL